MSKWRRMADEHMPSLHRLIADKAVDSPMMLWIELHMRFSRECDTLSPNPQVLDEIWEFSRYSLMQSENEDISTAVVVAFYEHLLDSKKIYHDLPNRMTTAQFLNMEDVFLYHNSREKYERIKADFIEKRKSIEKTLRKKPQRAAACDRGTRCG